MDNTGFNYREFLKEKHSKLQTSDEIIQKIIFKATNLSVSSKTRIILGETNEVYDITLQDTTHVILRIFHNKQNRFANEEWAMEEVTKHGVPVAKILLIDEDETHIFCVMSKIPGRPLSEIKEFENKEFAQKIITKGGKILSDIHKVHANGFGELLNRGQGKYQTYKEWIDKIISKKDEYYEVSRKNDFKTSFIDHSLLILQKHRDIFEGETPILAHSDWAPKHIMVEGDTITGILDFGNCHGASPIHDFAWWQYWEHNDEQIQWLKDGYDDKSLFDKTFDMKFHILKLIIGLELFWWNDNVGHLGGIQLSKESIQDDLAFFT